MSARACQACGAEIPDDARFCTKCGKEVGMRVCQSCGTKAIEGARFCQNCGNEVVSAPRLEQRTQAPKVAAEKRPKMRWQVRLAITLPVLILLGIFIFNDLRNQDQTTPVTTLPTPLPPTTITPPRTTTTVPTTTTPTRPSGPNLTFYTPQGWESPLIVASSPKATMSSTLTVGQPVYISFALQNNGTEPLPSSFVADVMFDNIVVHRVFFNPIRPQYNSMVTDWADLPATVKITPGKHFVYVLLDTTGLTGGKHGKDNSIFLVLEWAPPAVPVPPAAALKRKPNLVPFKRDGWDGIIVATSIKDDIKDDRAISGPLSVDIPTYLSYGIKNTGLTSVTGPFWVYTYVDGVLVGQAQWTDKRSDSMSWRSVINLADTVRLSPGQHKVRVEVDATRLIDESSESDNVYEQTFVWGTGKGPFPLTPQPPPTPTPKPVAPFPLTLPNLESYYGYPDLLNQPIFVATTRDGKSAGQLTEKGLAFVNIVVQNVSTIPVPSGFAVDLYFDGRKVQRFSTTSTLEGGHLFIWTWDALANAGQITPGFHTLKMVIDPDNRVAEANENDNVFETTVPWSPVITPPYTYPADLLSGVISGLVEHLDVREPAVGGKTDWRSNALSTADAAYYLVTGKSLLKEPVQVNLLTGKEFREWTDSYYMGKFAMALASDYPKLLEERERKKYVNRGYKGRRFGKLQIVIDAEVTPAKLVRTIIHESGHMRQDLLNPKQNGDSLNEKALREAEAQVWEVVLLRALEQRGRVSLSPYPDIPDYRFYADYQIDYLLGEVGKDEHWRGQLLLWGAALADDVPGLRQEVMNGPLSSASANRLYDFLVKLPYNIDEYVNSRVQSVTSENGVQLIKSLAKKRLVPNLAGDLEGSPDLARTFLTTP